MVHTTPSPARAALRIASAVGAVALVLSACGKATETGIEELIESQGGGDVELDLDGGGFSVETEDGSMTVDEDGNFVVTDESGEVVTGNAGEEDGDFTVESDDGEFRIDSSGDIPDEWPDDAPVPEGISGATSTVMANADEIGISVNGAADPSFIEEYGSTLESAGYERTSNFESAGNITRIYENGSWTISVNQFGEGADTQVSVSLFTNAAG